MLYDRAKVYATAGGGGNGSASFRREKFAPMGGPDGGDGGRGGSVYLTVDPQLNTLLPFRYHKHFKAKNGGNGGHQQMHGKAGEDLYISVPPGTVFTVEAEPLEGVPAEDLEEQYTHIGYIDLDKTPDTIGERDPEVEAQRRIADRRKARITGAILMTGDLVLPGQSVMISRGGRGGLGNVHFKTSTRQAPKLAQNGEPGQRVMLHLELKVIADVGLVGYPNAGKSSTLKAVSAATPDIADYPFTTLEPVLGVVDGGDDFSFVMADIPGLIEGAHTGVGLGIEFLRHVERTRLLVHMIDGSGEFGTRDVIRDYEQINTELAAYRAELATRPQIAAINKIDLPETQANLPALREYFTKNGVEFYEISAATRQGTQQLVYAISRRLRELQPITVGPDMHAAIVAPGGVMLQGGFTGQIRQETRVLDDEDFALPVLSPDSIAANALVRQNQNEATKGIRQMGERARRSADDAFNVINLGENRWRVVGRRVERVVAMTNMDNYDSLAALQVEFDKMGISKALEKAGVVVGDTVYFGKASLEWQGEALDEEETRIIQRLNERGSRNDIRGQTFKHKP